MIQSNCIAKEEKEMKNRIVTADEFADAMKDILNDYGDKVHEVIEDVEKKVAKESVSDLKEANEGETPWKKYPKSWTSETKKITGGFETRIYNSKHYRLTHLLEFGHAKVNGGRTRAYPHIASVNDKTQREFVEELKKGLTE